MEPRLVIFIGFSALALIINTAMIFAAYKALSGMSEKIDKSMQKLEIGAQAREWLPKMLTASESAVKATQNVKDQLAGLDPVIQRIHMSYADCLAKTDVRMGLVCRALDFTVDMADRFITWPIRHMSSAAAGIQGVISFFRGSENGRSARSRQTR
jgi:hypothetical protein